VRWMDVTLPTADSRKPLSVNAEEAGGGGGGGGGGGEFNQRCAELVLHERLTYASISSMRALYNIGQPFSDRMVPTG